MEHKLEIVYLPVKDIYPYKNNNKTHADNVDSIANSIECFGFQIPIVVNKEHVVITGHGRLMAAQKLGLKEIPCIISNLDKEAEDEFRIIDNVTQSLGKLDFASVAKEIMGGRVHSKYHHYGHQEHSPAGSQDPQEAQHVAARSWYGRRSGW